MYTEFNKVNLKIVREDISAILSKYAKETGIELSIGNIRFTEGSFTAKLDAKIKGAKTKEDSVLEFMMVTKGLAKTSKCGKTLVGYNSRAGKYPFVFESAGKRYKCSENNAKMYFQV